MELQKDLHSLKSLYELLQTTAIDIDEGARLLFKNLLDSARDNLWLASSKVVAIGSPMPHMNTKKRCRICQQSSEEMANDFSRDVSNSIETIDSAILSLSLEEPAVASWTQNSQRNEAPAYHYVHGLRIPSIQDNNGALALPNKSFGEVAKSRSIIQTPIGCASTAHSHNQKGLTPMLLDYNKSSSVKTPYARQQPSPYRKESEISSSSSQGSAVSSPITTSYTSTSQPETESGSPEESRGNSTDYSSESYGTSGNRHRKKSDKPVGRFRRLKNKIGFIFHHHHHHHHHHHRESRTKERRTSAWKHLGMIFHRKDKERAYEKQAVGKPKKQPVSKKQAGQFQALMKGMVRHVKQSKKSKMHTHRSKRHWWKMFKGHRRVRLQVKPKKPLLKGPKLVRKHL